MIDYEVYSLGELLDQLNVENVEEKLQEEFKKFSCPNERDLESFLVHKAIEYQRIQFGKTFLFLNSKSLSNDILDIMAFFTTGQTAIDISDLAQKKKRRVIGSGIPGRDHMKSIPGFLIGQIGRDERYSHDDLSGEQILKECYKKIEEARTIIGGNIIILECRKKMFELFYEKQGFKQLPAAKGDELMKLYKRIA